MSKFQIRSPLIRAAMCTAGMALAPALAFAGPKNQKQTTTTTTTTSSPQGNTTTTAPGMQGNQGNQGNIDQQGSAVMSPSTPPDMTEADAMRANRLGNPDQSSIDPAQVQKVFGMDVSLIDLKTLNKDQIKQLQQRLQERGFYRSKVDGVMGPQTRNALTALMAQQYALNQRLVNDGQITEQFATSMGLDTRGRAPVSGVDQNDQAGQHPAPRSNAQSTTPTTPMPPNQ